MLEGGALGLFIVEIINVAVNLIFLGLFIYRFAILRSYSRTNRYKDYFPKLRIFFSFAYIILSASLLAYNLVTNEYQSDLLDLILGGIGECIDSVILTIQLFVLRLELLKQQPYTVYHVGYFIYLALISLVRFLFTMLNIPQKAQIADIVISILFVIDSCMQLAYWIAKKQSLPQFQIHTTAQIDDLRHHSKLIPKMENTQRSYWKTDDSFPYIIPSVSIQNGRIKIILEAINNFKNHEFDQTSVPPKKDTYLAPLFKHNFSESKETSYSRQILSVSFYSIEELKRFYVVCGRFPMEKKVQFEGIELPQMARSLQQLLQQLFKQKRWYQASVLRYLKLPLQKLNEYTQLMQKSNENNLTEIDPTIGLRLLDDKNAIYFSILIYKHLWVDDHFEFYIKIVGKISKNVVYPIRRYSEFEDLHISFRNMIKNMGRSIQLPLLPKKHLFHWNQDQETSQRRTALEKYLRQLSNDYVIMEIPCLRAKLFEFFELEHQLSFEGKFESEFYQNLKVLKGEITKALIKNEYVTFYEFKLFKNGIEVIQINKRFSQFEQLHKQLQRWMHNIQITYKVIALPEKVYFKSESNRHDKLKVYLQNIIEIKQIGRLYALNYFLNIEGNETERVSDISAINSRSKPSRYNQANSNVINEVIELAQQLVPTNRFSNTSQSSRRFSHIMNNLGQEFD